MSATNKHDAAVKAAMKAMQSGGAKFPSWGKAFKFLSPLLTAKLLFEGLRQIPGIGTVMEKIDDLDAWVNKNTLGRIPVLKWSNALKKVSQNFLSGGDKGIKDYIHEDGKGEVETSENDRAWYEPGYSVTIPTNEARPVDLNMVPLFTPDKSFLGGIAKLSKLCISGYSMYRSKSIRNTVQTIFKSMRDNLKSNITYTVDDVMCVLLNNISIYMMQKHLERRIGFTKFEDPEFKAFYDLWRKKSLLSVNFGVYDLDNNNSLDVTSVEYGIALDIYEKLVSMSDRCILPTHFKDWIDHYFGSVMVLDDDVANKKYIVVQADSVPFYAIHDGQIVESTIALEDDILTPEYMYDFIDSYFHDTKVATIISDYAKAAEFGKVWNLSGFTTGWLTSMRDYKPVPIIDKGFKQALINAYTYDGSREGFATPNYYRLDRINDTADDLTTYLFLGKLFNNRNNVRIFGTKTWEANRVEVLVYASELTPVYLPITLTQKQIFINDDRTITKTKPFALVLQSNVSSDIYIGANVSIAQVQTRFYGPTNAYPKFTPATTELTCNISADRNSKLSIPAPRALLSVSRSLFFYLPLAMSVDNSDTPILFYKKTVFNSLTLLQGDIKYTGSGELGNLYYATPTDDIYSVLVNNSLNPMISLYEPDEDEEHAAGHSFGAVGTITIKQLSSPMPASIDIIFDFYSMSIGVQTESEASQLWIQYSLYPNSDISTQFCLVTEDETKVKAPSFNYGYVHLPSTLFTMLGYSIPVYQNIVTHVSVLDQTYTDIMVDQILLKEDYIPFYINADDFPYVIDTMYDGLFNYKSESDVKVESKSE